MGLMDDETRAALMRLVPEVAVEGRRIVTAFAERHGLHETDVEALSHVMLAEAQALPLTAGALGQALKLTSGATTFVMNRLCRAGLVERVRGDGDQRKVHLRLSAEGRAMAAATYPPIVALSGAVMDAFTPAELETVRRFLAATTQAMASYRSSIKEGLLSKDPGTPPKA
jgi:DNA-binding MarR family transcriptional regulator